MKAIVGIAVLALAIIGGAWAFFAINRDIRERRCPTCGRDLPEGHRDFICPDCRDLG